MVKFICLFLPGIFAFCLFEFLQKNKYTIFYKIVLILIFELFINFSCFIALFFGHNGAIVLDNFDFNVTLSIKYLTIALLSGSSLAILFSIMLKNIDFRIIVDSKEENLQKNNP